jgi:hypothetical protein
VLNDALLLRRHASLHEQLAAAMQRGESVGACVRRIEAALAGSDADVLGPGEGGAAGAAAFIGGSSGGSGGASAESSQQQEA